MPQDVADLEGVGAGSRRPYADRLAEIVEPDVLEVRCVLDAPPRVLDDEDRKGAARVGCAEKHPR